MDRAKIESGIETAMISVLATSQKQQDHHAGQQAAMTPSRTTPAMAARTKMDWSKVP